MKKLIIAALLAASFFSFSANANAACNGKLIWDGWFYTGSFSVVGIRFNYIGRTDDPNVVIKWIEDNPDMRGDVLQRDSGCLEDSRVWYRYQDGKWWRA